MSAWLTFSLTFTTLHETTNIQQFWTLRPLPNTILVHLTIFSPQSEKSLISRKGNAPETIQLVPYHLNISKLQKHTYVLCIQLVIATTPLHKTLHPEKIFEP